MKYSINPVLWTLDDERIDELYAGKLSVTGFIRAMKPSDPWELLLAGEFILQAYTRKHLERLQEECAMVRRKRLSLTGGLTGGDIYRKSKVFLAVYPELQETFDDVKASIGSAKCPRCVLGKKSMPLLVKLMSLSPKCRNLDKLNGVVNDKTMRILRSGAPVPEGEIDIPWLIVKKPKPVKARTLPVKTVWRFDDEEEADVVKKMTKRRISKPRDDHCDGCRLKTE